MSNVHAPSNLKQQLAGRWQMPLLLISFAALGAGIWRLRPEHRVPEFEPLFRHAQTLYKARLYPEAAGYIEQLLAVPQRTAEQKRSLHILLADVLFEHEQNSLVHSERNAERLIELTALAYPEGGPRDAKTLLRRALAYEWLRKPDLAVAAYQDAVAAGLEDPWPVRRRILDIQRATGDADDDTLQAECEAMVNGSGVSDALAYWAAEQVVEVLSRRQRYGDAERFLEAHAERFRHSGEKRGFDYLQALVMFHVGKKKDAERFLRAIRDDLEPSDPVFARAGLLLGRLLLDGEAPEYALAFFEDVLAQKPTGVIHGSAVLGRAEALDALERYEEALAGYDDVIRAATETPYDSPFDSAPAAGPGHDAAAEMVSGKWRLPKITRYLRTVNRRAELCLFIGKAALARARKAPEPDAAVEQDRAHRFLVRAGEYFQRLAGLIMLDDEGATGALQAAADAYELAQEYGSTIAVMEQLVREHPDSPQVPGALLRLGQTFQAIGQFDRAIESYQQNLIQFPRTPAAIASLVPLAECFRLTGRPDKAEQTLLRLVQRSPDDPLGLVTPAAVQFREAIFGLADLYSESGAYEKAIGRYEEALERYPDDPRLDRAVFMLAEAYRRSAQQVRRETSAGEGAAFREELTRAHKSRLERARQLYVQVIDHYRKQDAAELSDLQRLHLKLSYLYSADCAFESALVRRAQADPPAIDVLGLYEQAAWACAKDPIALAAYVQMVNCHLREGRQEKARIALQRAQWVLRNIPDQAFEGGVPSEGRAYWEEYLTWLGKTPALSATRPAAG